MARRVKSSALQTSDSDVSSKKPTISRRVRRGLQRYKLRWLIAIVLAVALVTIIASAFLVERKAPAKVRRKHNGPRGLASVYAPWPLRPEWNQTKLKRSSRYLVTKGSARRANVAKQVTAPETHRKTGKRTFGCLRDECRGLSMEDLVNRRWRLYYKSAKSADGLHFRDDLYVKLTMLLTDTTDMAKLKKGKPDLYHTIYTAQEGRTYLSAIDGADAIGGNKGQQLRTKTSFVRRFKRCTYNDLNLQPEQYRLYIKSECDALSSKSSTSKTYLLKPETGSQGKGISFHKTPGSIKKKAPEFFPCNQNPSMSALERMLVQEYIERPLLLHGSKFDVRVYMLIASTDPWIVFYHQGYLRRSLFEYSATSKNRAVFLTNTHYQSMKPGFKLSDHVWTFATFQDYLTRTGKTGPHYVESVLDPYLKRVSNFVFQSARKKLVRRKGSFQIFGLDFMIDERFKVHFIEANGYPGYTWSINFDTRGMVSEKFDLLQEINEFPLAFERMRAGDHYGGFEMIFSEVEEELLNITYNPCYEFFNNDLSFGVYRKGMRHFAEFTGYAGAKTKMSLRVLTEATGDCQSKKCQTSKGLIGKEVSRARRNMERTFEGYGDDFTGSSGIGGTKADQFSSLFHSARAHGCHLNKLGLIPATYRMYIKEECLRVQNYKTASRWVAKPLDNRQANGFKFYSHQSEIGSDFSCDDLPSSKKVVASEQELFSSAPPQNQVLMQKHMSDLLVVNGKSWTLKAYMLIARSEPYLVFFTRGFCLSSRFDEAGQRIILGEDVMSFEDLQDWLSKESKTGAHFVDTVVDVYIQRVMRAVFEAVRPQLESQKRSYQMFDLNFIIDSTFTLWYISANRNPPGNKFMDEFKSDWISLVTEMEDMPEVFTQLRYGDRYGHFRLIWSDFEAEARPIQRKICEEFSSKWSHSKAVLAGTAKLHDASNRAEHANLRELKKYTKIAWDKCRSRSSTEFCVTRSEATKKALAERYAIYVSKSKPKDPDVDVYIKTRLAELSGGFNETAVAEG